VNKLTRKMFLTGAVALTTVPLFGFHNNPICVLGLTFQNAGTKTIHEQWQCTLQAVR
jgi:hypothetical protein